MQLVIWNWKCVEGYYWLAWNWWRRRKIFQTY